jgi:transcriptional regulator with XRE-family HTH domain
MIKKYNSVSEMVKDISSNSELADSVAKEIRNRRMAKFLFSQRCKHNLTQKQMAEKIECSQSRVSKIENSYDRDISVGDLLDYAKALDLQLEMGFRHHSARIVDLIKYHAFKIKAYLNQLATLAQDDEEMGKGVAKFHLEAKHNIDRLIASSFSKLSIIKKLRISDKTNIHISEPIDKLATLRESDLIRK